MIQVSVNLPFIWASFLTFSQALTTKDGKLVITLEEKRINDLNFQSGMDNIYCCFNVLFVLNCVDLRNVDFVE